MEMQDHCVKSVRIRSYSGPHFPPFGLNMDQNNSKYGHFLRSGLDLQSRKKCMNQSKEVMPNHTGTGNFDIYFV